LAAGWWGVQEPFSNIVPTTVWVIWWVGLAYLSGLAGNLWALLNPWNNLYLAFEWLLARRRAGCDRSVLLRLPNWIGVWPAVILFLAFAWLELVWGNSDRPHSIATAVFGYSLLTWLGMGLFGREVWLRQGEVFSLLFGVLARFSLTEVRVTNRGLCASCDAPGCRELDGDCVDCMDCFRHAAATEREWNLRPWGIGLLTARPVSFSLLCFVVLMLATVTFDGLLATPLWAEIVQWALYSEQVRPLLLLLQPFFSDAISVISSVGMVLFALLFVLVFLLFSLMMKWAVGGTTGIDVRSIAGSFVLTLVPIALAYHLAHYLSYLLIVGQYMIPLVSDPFGYGWDLFGTKLYFVDIGIVNARFIWITSVIVIVVGHIFSVFLAHVMALRLFKTSRLVLLSQIPMLLLMVGYTMISLWILAQPIVE